MENKKTISMVTCSPGFVYFVGDNNKQKTLGKIEPTMESKSKMFNPWKIYNRNKETGENNKDPSSRQAPNNTNFFPIVPTPSSPKNESRDNKKAFWRKVPPYLAFLVAFSTAMASLLVWSQAAALRRQAFDMNLTKDSIYNIPMDNAQLIQYIRILKLTKTTNQEELNVTQSWEEMIVDNLSQRKQDGVYVEYLCRIGARSTTAWLDKHLNWSGVIVIPDSLSFYKAKKTTRNPNTRLIQACLSTDTNTKQITLPQESDVQVKKLDESPNSLSSLDDTLPSRVSSFPLYSILLAYNTTTVDYLSLDGQDLQDLQVLDTIPWDKVKIYIIFIHWNAHHSETDKKNVIEKLANRRYKYISQDANKLIFHYNRQLKI